MGTAINAIRSISNYPIPENMLLDALDENGINEDDELTPEIRNSASFKRAKARVYEYLAIAPNVSQGGVSFSFTSKEKEIFLQNARNLMAEAGVEDGAVCYGWIGEDF